MQINYKEILEQPSYWKEAINGAFYNAILEYMQKHNLNRSQLAKELDLSKGRISQILNDGEINFSIDKLIEISLKIDKFPNVEFIDKTIYLNKHSRKTVVDPKKFLPKKKSSS